MTSETRTPEVVRAELQRRLAQLGQLSADFADPRLDEALEVFDRILPAAVGFLEVFSDGDVGQESHRVARMQRCRDILAEDLDLLRIGLRLKMQAKVVNAAGRGSQMAATTTWQDGATWD